MQRLHTNGELYSLRLDERRAEHRFRVRACVRLSFSDNEMGIRRLVDSSFQPVIECMTKWSAQSEPPLCPPLARAPQSPTLALVRSHSITLRWQGYDRALQWCQEARPGAYEVQCERVMSTGDWQRLRPVESSGAGEDDISQDVATPFYVFDPSGERDTQEIGGRATRSTIAMGLCRITQEQDGQPHPPNVYCPFAPLPPGPPP